MAEIAVLNAITKIGIAVAGEVLNLTKPLLAKKAELVIALPSNMELIKEELELINAFLNQIGMKECNDAVLEAWIRQVRRLAFDSEDIVDQFIYVVGEHRGKGLCATLKKCMKKPQYLFSMDEIATEVERVRKKLMDLSRRREQWVQQIVGRLDILGPNYAGEQQAYLPGRDHSIDDGELVGIDENKEKLINLLHLEDPAMHILAVWGMGGLGKSTLVRNVYKNEGSQFDCRAWISVSQSYKMDDILRNMLREFYGNDKKLPFDVERLNIEDLRAEVKKFIDQKRCLIILDDVWTTTVFLEIKDILFDNGHQNRVVITTRLDEVASVAEDDYKIKLEPLNKDDAWTLFCKKAFWRIGNHACPTELQMLGEEIVNKCGGLPLALVALGSLLSLKPMNEAEWKRVRDQLMWELQNNPNLNHVKRILNLSYKYLPNYLKNCFLYCAMFPEDYLLRRKKLIKLWIAEGFIEQRGTSSLEEVAESYLVELVQRSMLQDAERNSFGRMKHFRMHDLVRELAISLSDKESFNSIYDDSSGVIQVASDSRRLSVLQCKNGTALSIDVSRLRTFLAFDTSMSSSSSWLSFIFSKSKYLAVLDLSTFSIENEAIPHSIGELFNLKYLCLDNTNVKSLPKSINKLHNLETLSLQGAQLLKLPLGFEKLKKLRHLIIWKYLDPLYKSFKSSASMEAFEGLWNLKELQSLNVACAGKKNLVEKLGNLSQLRCLDISDVKSSHCAYLCSSLSKMHKLSNLGIQASNEDEVLQLKHFTSPPLSLKKLLLSGRLVEGTLESPMFLAIGNTLRVLHLHWCQLREDPISHISELSNLTQLSLRRVYCGQQLSFHAGWFPNLKELILRDFPQVNQIYIENETLVNLEYLEFSDFNELKDVPGGLKFLLSIKDVWFVDMHPDFTSNLQERIQKGELNYIQNIHQV